MAHPPALEQPPHPPGSGAPPPWHALEASDVLARLGTSSAGLSRAEAAERLRREGPNALPEARGIQPLGILVRQFESLLVALLAIAAAISAFLGETIDALAILGIVVVNGAIGFLQEWGAARSIAALRRLAVPRARVRRQGPTERIPAAELVPGDLVLLEAGDRVPADLRLLEVARLRMVEAALTGESEPVEKRATRLEPSDLALGDRANLAFMGTGVAAGTATGVVVATGAATEVGRIAGLLAQERPPGATPLQARLDALGRVLVGASLAIVVVLFAGGLARGLPLLELALTSISLAVAAVPEGLPVVVTIALAVGMTRMARRRALIRHLPAVETLGSASVICTDKTGTLTRGEMTVRALHCGGVDFEVRGEGYAPEGAVLRDGQPPDADQRGLLRELAIALAACNDAELVRRDDHFAVVGDPTEGALLAACAKLEVRRDELARERPRARAWPFDSDRKRMSVACALPGGALRLFVKGAPDLLLERCARVRTSAGDRPLEESLRRGIESAGARFAERALRVLGAAYRDLPPGARPAEDPDAVERDLTFLGLAGMYDPPRPEARRAVERCREAGVRVVMITGDHPRTALAVARELGVADSAEQTLAGPELERLTPEALRERAPRISVYARVAAEHKLRIVRAWQESGAVVAMTGDGVNDAPAIQGADVGVAMGITGTEVTKEASDMIVTDDDFASIVAAIEEGRGVYANIRKTLQYLLAGNAAELLLMAACIVLGLPVPLLPIHLLWINLVTDGLPALCLATDPLEPDLMRAPPRPRGESIIDHGFRATLLLTAALTAGASFAAYLLGLSAGDEEQARTNAFATLVFAELLRSFGARSERRLLWTVGLLSNLRLAAVVAGGFALQLSTHHIPVLRTALRTSELPWEQCAVLVSLSLIPLLVLEARKLAASRRGARPT